MDHPNKLTFFREKKNWLLKCRQMVSLSMEEFLQYLWRSTSRGKLLVWGISPSFHRAFLCGKYYHHNLYGKNYHHAPQHLSISYCLVIINVHLFETKRAIFSGNSICFPHFWHMENLCALFYLERLITESQSQRAGQRIWFNFWPLIPLGPPNDKQQWESGNAGHGYHRPRLSKRARTL